VNCVAPKISQKVSVLLQHDDLDAGTSQQKTQHHPGGPSADDAALGLEVRIQGRTAPAYTQ
jgi:hypothetical protein